MYIKDLGEYYQKRLSDIKKLTAPLSQWEKEAHEVLARADADITDLDEFMEVLHETQRLHKIYLAGLAGSKSFKEAYKAAQDEGSVPTWKDFTPPPADEELQHHLADKLYNVKPGGDDFAFVSVGETAPVVGKKLFEKLQADNIPFTLQFEDTNFGHLLLNHATADGVKNLAADVLAMAAKANKRIGAHSGLPAKEIEADEEKSHLYSSEMKPYRERLSSGDLFFTITSIPTPRDAEIDGFEYEDYVRMFFEACDQPWEHIAKAQIELIKEFNAAKELRITNDAGTDIKMDIEGFTFCNSLIAKNVPGSEIFSAPRASSVEGTIVAQGRFERGGQVMEDLKMVFNQGKLTSYEVGKNEEAFKKIISVDNGARYVGEIGIGTNPHLKTHLSNGLMVEKIGGSFHVALGAAYTMQEYQGDKVNVDNGNRSALHWDITTMLHGKGGKMYLDGRMIMDDGKFLDNKYDVLNRGWEALPKEERPEYWQQKRPLPTPKI